MRYEHPTKPSLDVRPSVCIKLHICVSKVLPTAQRCEEAILVDCTMFNGYGSYGGVCSGYNGKERMGVGIGSADRSW